VNHNSRGIREDTGEYITRVFLPAPGTFIRWTLSKTVSETFSIFPAKRRCFFTLARDISK